MTDWHITVNWASEDAELDADLADFRIRHPGVTFERVPGWTPGPGSDQWPRIIIKSGSLPAIQEAIRNFAASDNPVIEETWEFEPDTCAIAEANFTWMSGRTGCEWCGVFNVT